MITEDYVSLKVAKLLKEKGFKEWCRKCYGLDVRHNGESIDVDEEYELRDAGKENEIEYVDGGRMYDYGCGNFNPGGPYAAPTLAIAMKWLREVHNQIIVPGIRLYDGTSGTINCYIVGIWYIPKNNGGAFCYTSPTPYEGYPSFEEACEAGIRYCLENLI